MGQVHEAYRRINTHVHKQKCTLVKPNSLSHTHIRTHRPKHGIVFNTWIVFTVATAADRAFHSTASTFFLLKCSTSKCSSQSFGIVEISGETLVECLPAQRGGRIHFTFPYIRALSSHDTVLHTAPREREREERMTDPAQLNGLPSPERKL